MYINGKARLPQPLLHLGDHRLADHEVHPLACPDISRVQAAARLMRGAAGASGEVKERMAGVPKPASEPYERSGLGHRSRLPVTLLPLEHRAPQQAFAGSNGALEPAPGMRDTDQ